MPAYYPLPQRGTRTLTLHFTRRYILSASRHPLRPTFYHIPNWNHSSSFGIIIIIIIIIIHQLITLLQCQRLAQRYSTHPKKTVTVTVDSVSVLPLWELWSKPVRIPSVHFFWLVNVCFCCARFSFSIPSQEIGLANVSEMNYFVLSGT